ncbi:hypothetical protein KUV46_00585 [Thalassovita mediterranea]|nr:hypothetical protein KUV46_00585 [Thalassovita mediterranea]
MTKLKKAIALACVSGGLIGQASAVSIYVTDVMVGNKRVGQEITVECADGTTHRDIGYYPNENQLTRLCPDGLINQPEERPESRNAIDPGRLQIERSSINRQR